MNSSPMALVYLTLALSFLISGCDDPKTYGSIVTEYDWECVKTGLGSGVGFSGGNSVVMLTSQCEINKCFEYRRTIFNGPDKVERLKIVDDNFCVGEL